MKTKNAVLTRKPRPTDKVQCGRCYARVFRRRDGTPNPNGVLYCPGCAPHAAPPRPARRPARLPRYAGMRWYVVQVEPKKEAEFRSSLNRRVRIDGLEAKIGKIVVTTMLRNDVKPVYETLDHGAEGDMRSARFVGGRAAARLLGTTVLRLHEHPGVRVHVARNMKTEEWEWKVQRLTGTEHKTVRTKRMPGYVLVQLDYSPEVHQIVKKTRYCWDFLIRPVDQNTHRVFLAWSKRAGGWMWQVRDKEGKGVVRRGGPEPTKEAARWRANVAKADLERFVPTPVGDDEAKALLTAERAVRQIVKDRIEKNRVAVTVKVGGPCVVVEGVYRNVTGVVTGIDKKDPTHPMVKFRCRLMDRELELSVPAWEVKATK